MLTCVCVCVHAHATCTMCKYACVYHVCTRQVLLIQGAVAGHPQDTPKTTPRPPGLAPKARKKARTKAPEVAQEGPQEGLGEARGRPQEGEGPAKALEGRGGPRKTPGAPGREILRAARSRGGPIEFVEDASEFGRCVRERACVNVRA